MGERHSYNQVHYQLKVMKVPISFGVGCGVFFLFLFFTGTPTRTMVKLAASWIEVCVPKCHRTPIFYGMFFRLLFCQSECSVWCIVHMNGTVFSHWWLVVQVPKMPFYLNFFLFFCSTVLMKRGTLLNTD